MTGERCSNGDFDDADSDPGWSLHHRGGGSQWRRPWPAVIVFFDAGGLRPAQARIAERIASSGYLVVQPDLFHRAPPLETLIGGPVTLASIVKVFQDPDLRAAQTRTRYYSCASCPTTYIS
jgi:dienelactone hydrolase